MLITQSRENYSPVIIPGNPQKSRLIRVLETGFMPPDGGLGEEQIQLIRSWIAADCPADFPAAVYGATFFQNWGSLLCVWAGLNLITVGIFWRESLPLGPLLVVLGAIPVTALKASTAYWYPGDLCAAGIVGGMVLGGVVGGVLISVAKQGSSMAGAGWGLLAPVGLILLARRNDDDRAAETADGEPPASAGPSSTSTE